MVESTSMDLDPFKGKFMSNEYVSVGQITVPAPESAPIETFSRTTAKHWTAWRELMAEIMAVEVRGELGTCLARAEGYALALLDSDLVTEEENIQLGVEISERSTLRDWELQGREKTRG